jgi:hypothetical protein
MVLPDIINHVTSLWMQGPIHSPPGRDSHRRAIILAWPRGWLAHCDDPANTAVILGEKSFRHCPRSRLLSVREKTDPGVDHLPPE